MRAPSLLARLAFCKVRKICELSQIICGLTPLFTQKQHPKYMGFIPCFIQKQHSSTNNAK